MSMVSMVVVACRTVTLTNASQSLTDLGFSQDEVDQADIALITAAADANYRVDGDAATTVAGSNHVIKALIDTEIRGNVLLAGLELIRSGGADVAAIITLEKF